MPFGQVAISLGVWQGPLPPVHHRPRSV